MGSSKSGGAATSFALFSGVPENHITAYVPPEYKTFSNALTDFSAPPISTVGAGLVAGAPTGPAPTVAGAAGMSPVQIDDSGRYLAFDMKVMEPRMTAYQAPELLSGDALKATSAAIAPPPAGVAAATVTTADLSSTQPDAGVGPGVGGAVIPTILVGAASTAVAAHAPKTSAGAPEPYVSPAMKELLNEQKDFTNPELGAIEVDVTDFTPKKDLTWNDKDSKFKNGSPQKVKKAGTSFTDPALKPPGKGSTKPAQQIPSMPTDSHYGGFRFRVSIEGITVDRINDAFTKISGLTSQSEEIPFMHGTDPYVYLAPGRSKFEPVEFERVYNGIDTFYKWRRDIEQGTFDDEQRVGVRIEVLSIKGEVVRTMVLVNAWPIKWEMPDLDAGASGPAIEKFSLACKEIYEE